MISALMHECKHVDHRIHHNKHFEFYRKNKTFSNEHYSDGLNLIELDSVLFGRYFGRINMDWIFSKYSVETIIDMARFRDYSTIRKAVENWVMGNHSELAWFSEEELSFFDSHYSDWIKSVSSHS